MKKRSLDFFLLRFFVSRQKNEEVFYQGKVQKKK
jgi:hypothetical protein